MIATLAARSVKRRELAFSLRQKGYTYELIGKHLSVSKARARELVLRVERDKGKKLNAFMTIDEVIKDLIRCAVQNEKDSKVLDGYFGAQANAVAGEQRRMIKILKSL